MNDPSSPIAEVTLPAPASRRRRPFLWATLGLSVASWAALAMGAATPLKGFAERKASAALGRPVSIGGSLRIIVTPFSIRFQADQVGIANPDWTESAALLSAGSIEARLATFDLLLGKPGFRALSIEDGTLDLERSADGKRSNWASADAGSLFDLGSVRQVGADGLTLRYRDPGTRTDARLALSAGGRGIVDMTGGGLIQGRDVTLNGSLQSSEDRPASFDLRGRTEDFALLLEGSADAPLRLGSAKLTATAQGDDFAELAALGGIALPALPHYELTARIGRARQGWHFSHIDGRIGETDLAGSLTLTRRGARPLIVANLSSRKLDRGDAMALLSMRDGADASVEELADAPLSGDSLLLPDAPLSAEALRRFDAVIDYKANRLIGLDHAPSHLTMKLALMDGRLQLSPASIDLAGGFVSSDIFIDARRSPALVRTDIRLSPTPMGRLLRGWGIAPSGTTAMVKGRIQLAGRGETLREAIGNADGRIALVLPAGDVRTHRASTSSLDMANLSDALFEATDEPAPATLNCGLIVFTVRGGLASADPILIDTDGTVLSGKGTIDLRTETIDLKLTPNAKTGGWFGRPMPVTISGTLNDAYVEREPVNWFRPASFFGFSMMLPDLKRVFGFVDPDETDAPACGPILQGAPSSAQRQREYASLR